MTRRPLYFGIVVACLSHSFAIPEIRDDIEIKYSKTHHYEKVKIHVTQVNRARPEGGLPHAHYAIVLEGLGVDGAERMGELVGWIVDSWITDLDDDGLFEVALWVSSFGSGHYLDLLFFEWDGKELDKHDLPEIKIFDGFGYSGHDGVSVTDRTLVRIFPVYRDMDPNCCPSGGAATLVYEYKANHFRLEKATIEPDKEPECVGH